jgi:hypothetical protein
MNREIVIPGGAGVYPLTGDVLSQAGNPTVQVVGLRGIPVADSFLNGGEVLEYNVNTHSWEPVLRAAIQVNGITVSDDYIITVNVQKSVLVNGS